MTLPKRLVELINSNICIDSITPLPSRYADVNNFNEIQAGYRFNSITKECLTSDENGSWRNSWFVFAQNYFNDPFYIDFTEEHMGFPVYYSPHGAGKWTQIKIADSIEHFELILREIKNNESQLPFDLNTLSLDIDLDNIFWAEVAGICNDAEEFS